MKAGLFGIATRVVVADERALMRAALGSALDTERDLAVVATVPDRSALLERVGAVEARVCLISASLPPDGGPEACRQLRRRNADVRTLVIGDLADEDVLTAAIHAGADGYVTGEEPLERIVDAVRRIDDGQAVVPPDMLGPLLQSLADARRETEKAFSLFLRLTRREREILELLVDGCDHAAVADILVISPETARTHIQNVLRKLEVHSRVEAAAFAFRHDWMTRRPRRPRR